ALRAFEAAARLGSFKAAAEELFVTPTAISHQIRSLESTLGVGLFERRTRSVALTEVGRALAPALTRGFLEIRSGLESALDQVAVINLSTTPAFAALRLVPELPRFYACEPDIRVKIDTSTQLVDLHRDRGTDLVIRYSAHPQEGLADLPLMTEHFLALAAPSLVGTDIATEGTLLETRWQQPVLDDVSWADWFAAAGLPGPDESRLVTFDEELYVLQAAIAGRGIALASSVLAADIIARGLLQPMANAVVLPGASYRALALPRSLENRKIQAFLDWLKDAFGSATGAGP
ncbi:MAG: LysR substrate-binding domain-containing protein, partial [Gammaproteobacteria bacterium]